MLVPATSLMLTACPAPEQAPQTEQPNPNDFELPYEHTMTPNAEGLFKAPSTVPGSNPTEVIEINDNIPYFSSEDITTDAIYHFNSALDELGRVGEANAIIGTDSLPDTDRSSISNYEPTGWQQARYSTIGSGGWLYNRSHLIAYQLTGNDDFENLMTGTRWFNEEMIAFENFVAFYIEETENHVRYRVTPIFEGDNLLASGTYMEAFSIEDNGEGVMFNIYIPNVQEQVLINYETGESIGQEGPVQDQELPNFNQTEEKPLIKGNINSKGEKIYHKPGDPHYDRTQIDEEKGERYFYTEEEAKQAGWRSVK